MGLSVLMKTATAGAAMTERAWRSVSREAADVRLVRGMDCLRKDARVGELVHGDDEQGRSVVGCGWHVFEAELQSRFRS